MGNVVVAGAWVQNPGFQRLIATLGPGTARVVGGAVRDTLLGIETADFDVATTHPPETVIDLLEASGIKAVPTGLAHGTITAVASGEVYEVTTLRRDVATDGRHATVAFTDDWQEDAARRDFTINALYADPESGELFDYFGGVADLEARRIRFIGDPLQRIAEDHLRILRFFRFLARFGDEADAAGLAACTERSNDLMALSRERIANELLRLLVAPRAGEIVGLMIERGIFKPVLPEIADVARFAALAKREAAAGIAPDPIRRLAALLPVDAKVAFDIGARLKLSKKQRQQIESATHAPDANPRALAYRLGIDLALDRLLLAGEDVSPLTDWAPPKLPISGGQLVAKGLKAGPDVARTLHKIENRWVAEGFPDTARLAAITDEEVAQALDAIR